MQQFLSTHTAANTFDGNFLRWISEVPWHEISAIKRPDKKKTTNSERAELKISKQCVGNQEILNKWPYFYSAYRDPSKFRVKLPFICKSTHFLFFGLTGAALQAWKAFNKRENIFSSQSWSLLFSFFFSDKLSLCLLFKNFINKKKLLLKQLKISDFRITLWTWQLHCNQYWACFFYFCLLILTQASASRRRSWIKMR